MPDRADKVIVIGAGIGGLAAAARLAAAGLDVEVFETAGGPGGKIRTVESPAGPVDAGPTVLTLKPVFEELFDDCGARLEDQLRLSPIDPIARHFWADGTRLDLHADPAASRRAVETAFGPRAGADFARFEAEARRLFSAFEGPMMQRAAPSVRALARIVLSDPCLLLAMAPGRSLSSRLRSRFSESKLAQLFSRYATYVGGSPLRSPALLGLVWEAEARGVWSVNGGMQALADAVAALAKGNGARFRYATPVRRIIRQGGRIAAVETPEGAVPCDHVVFNGDPRALASGLLGPAVTEAVPDSAVEPRSLSAHVLAFAARASGPDLAYHNVFFSDEPDAEFPPIARGERPPDATLYLCAQDRAAGRPEGLERFELIMNAAPTGATHADPEDVTACLTQILDRLRQFGLTFDPEPGPEQMTTPAAFGQRFPASLGSLYGRSPHGLTAGLKRPRARTAIPGLYLAGGGAHPGAGVPMATLSGRHAAEAILTDLSSTSTSRRTAMPGGTSTDSAPMAAARSASSPL